MKVSFNTADGANMSIIVNNVDKTFVIVGVDVFAGCLAIVLAVAADIARARQRIVSLFL
jgi:hypothetical protein